MDKHICQHMSCSLQNDRECECLPGYVGNGVQCLEKIVPPVNRCLHDNGGCDPVANCKDLHYHGIATQPTTVTMETHAKKANTAYPLLCLNGQTRLITSEVGYFIVSAVWIRTKQIK